MLFKGQRNFAMGFALGFGAGVFAREIVPAVKEVARPVSRAFMEAGMKIVNRSQESVAQWMESIEDMVAETRSEVQTEEREIKEAKEPTVAQAEAEDVQEGQSNASAS